MTTLPERVPLTVCVGNELLESGDELRLKSFPENYNGTSSSSDAYDARAIHITGVVEANAAFYARLVPGPNSVFREWVEKPNTIPFTSRSVDLNRVCVHPRFRGKGLAKLVCVFAFEVATRHGFHTAIGTVAASSRMEDFLTHIGMQPFGGFLRETEPGDHTIEVQPFVINLNPPPADLQSRLDRVFQRASRAGFAIEMPGHFKMNRAG